MARRPQRAPRHSSQLHGNATPATRTEDGLSGAETLAVAVVDQVPTEGAQQGVTGVTTCRRWCTGSSIARAITAPPAQRRPRRSSRNGANFIGRSVQRKTRLANQRLTRGVLAKARGLWESRWKTSWQGKCAAISPCRLSTVQQANKESQQTEMCCDEPPQTSWVLGHKAPLHRLSIEPACRT